MEEQLMDYDEPEKEKQPADDESGAKDRQVEL